jgi:heme/copper-type cytochrome/quinol oxidase subunit 2
LAKLFKRHISSDKTFFQSYRYFHTRVLDISSLSHNRHFKRDFNVLNKILDSLPQRLTVDCNMIIAKDPKFLRLLTTDQCLVIPAKTPIRFLITSADVIHS